MDLLNILMDADNCEPIALQDEDGEIMRFKQVAVIPYGLAIYCVLKPLDEIERVADDETIVFRVDFDENGETIICLEEDEGTALAVFEKYYDLLADRADKD